MTEGGQKTQFDEVFDSEREQLKERRNVVGLEPLETRGMAGMALSGGGIRSAAFCLGVLQALAEKGIFRYVDYLSTVSGGGYIGSCVSSLLNDSELEEGTPARALSGDHFPLRKEAGRKEPPSLTHLRNCSNYLGSTGLLGSLRLMSLVVRGIYLNLVLLLPYLLFTALFTDFVYRLQYVLPIGNFTRVEYLAAWFAGALFVVLLLSFLFLSRGYGKSLNWTRRDSLERLVAIEMALFLFAVALIPFTSLVDRFLLYPWSGFQLGRFFHPTYWPVWLGAAIVGMMLLLIAATSSSPSPVLRRMVLYLIGLLGPLTLFGFYLLICLMFLRIPFVSASLAEELDLHANRTETDMLALGGSGNSTLLGELHRRGIVPEQGSWPPKYRVTREKNGAWYQWSIRQVAKKASQLVAVVIQQDDRLRIAVGPNAGSDTSAERLKEMLADWRSPTVLLGLALVMLALNRIFLNINITSPHGFYRDRLSRAFLIRATRRGVGSNDALKLSMLNREGTGGPYLLINAALNIAGSSIAASHMPDARGRDAGFFVFSKLYTGSDLTGYAETKAVEALDHQLDLGTAMAISAGAAAPRMGVTTVKPLVFILTLLNIRLGYWLPNPARIAQKSRRQYPGVGYMVREAFGHLREQSAYVNLSDGGHIENLGMYQLLRRHVTRIIAVDAEEDSGLEFKGLVTLIRYAAIDLGVEIRIDLSAIREKRAHYAVGEIVYGPNEPPGALLYLKSSVTGDENPYVQDYAKRNPLFPHQPTADQFFNETQFEAYRALGYHIGEGCAVEAETLLSIQ
jgi:hypothetical protein